MKHIYKTGLSGCILAMLLSGMIFSGCKKFVEIDPPRTKLASEIVFEDNITATAAMLMIYIRINDTRFSKDITFWSGMYSDELFSNSTARWDQAYYLNALDPVNNIPSGIWNGAYQLIYYANAVIEGVEKSGKLSPRVKKQLTAEAKMMRAFFHFYIINLFGDAPIATTTNYDLNNSLTRTPVADVYEHIIKDLTEAAADLNAEYVDNTDTIATQERVRPNKYVAWGLLARASLFKKDWAAAEKYASDVISATGRYSLEADLNKVFLVNSKETIWQIMMPTPLYTNTYEGEDFILQARPTYVTASEILLNAFEAGDKRKENWIGTYTDEAQTPHQDYYFPFKYKTKRSNVVTERPTALRLAEQYLIRAEARARQDDLDGAMQDLDAIRGRAGLPLIKDTHPSIGKADLLQLIFHERQVELFGEWGHRWLDIKRQENIDALMTNICTQKGAIWEHYKALWPIPLQEFQNNPKLLPQNPGYF